MNYLMDTCTLYDAGIGGGKVRITPIINLSPTYTSYCNSIPLLPKAAAGLMNVNMSGPPFDLPLLIYEPAFFVSR
jgi:hypothetical protein